MSATRDDLKLAQDERDYAGYMRGAALGTMRRRAVALLTALVIIGVFAVGWLADNVTAPLSGTSNALSQQVGLDTVTLTASPSPLRAYQATSLQLRLTDVSGRAVTGAHIQCELSMPDMGMSLPVSVAQPTTQPGAYSCPTATLTPGAWTLALIVRMTTGETDHATIHLVV